MESQYAPLSEACAKTLWDKTYDKRKVAAAEIEKYDIIFEHFFSHFPSFSFIDFTKFMLCLRFQSF